MGDLKRMSVGTQEVVQWLEALQQVYAGNRQWLTELDSAIGDADHGINMDRGFTAVKAELAAQVQTSEVAPDTGSVFRSVATTLIRHVGGAAGPLYGTFFLRAAAACAGKTRIEAADVLALFQAGIEGVQQRGKAAAGDKTMLDALIPALHAMRKAMADGSQLAAMLDAGAAAAHAGMLGTVPMQARKGRASYLGARSIGHQDPGAASSYLLLQAAADTWRS
jgi:dihydroxyacetone kinase-like protein